MKLAVRLRPAKIEDAELLFRWRNDQNSVRFSRSGRAVDPAEHGHWLNKALRSTGLTSIWIAERDGVAVGQIRLDANESEDLVSIAVDPSARGQGIATAMLEAVQRRATSRPLIADVHPENLPSMRLFSACGFRTVESGEAFVRFRWP